MTCITKDRSLSAIDVLCLMYNVPCFSQIVSIYCLGLFQILNNSGETF